MMLANKPSPEELEELVYKVICWMKKWALWDASTIFSRGKAFSSYHKRADYFGLAERKQSGWRGWEDVWVWGYGFEELCEDLQDALDLFVLAIECGGSLIDLLGQGIYAAEFDSLPDAAQIFLLRRIDLFESCVNWYDEYLERGGGLDDTEFDSFDEYWELESNNQEEFKLDLFKACLYAPLDEGVYRTLYGDALETDYNKKLAELILGELDEILVPYHLRRRVDPYSDLPLCIGQAKHDDDLRRAADAIDPHPALSAVAGVAGNP